MNIQQKLGTSRFICALQKQANELTRVLLGGDSEDQDYGAGSRISDQAAALLLRAGNRFFQPAAAYCSL